MPRPASHRQVASDRLRDGAILVNPVSGRGNGSRRTAEITRLAENLGWKGEVLETTADRHAGVLAAECVARGARRIIVCGGDGSVMEALDAISSTPAELGIVPLGTGNVFALNLGLPHGMLAALKVAMYGKPTPIDVGQANGTYFGVLAGIGWDAALVRDANRELKDRLGLLAYFLAAIRNLEHPLSRYKVSVDGKSQEVRAKSVLVANMGLIQGRLEVIPKARPDNGELTVAIVQAASLLSWVGLSASVLAGRLSDDPRIQLIQGRHIEITSLEGEQLVEADGNVLPPSQRLIVDVVPGGAMVLLPPGR